MFKEKIIIEMKEVFKEIPFGIEHTLKVLKNAEDIMKGENIGEEEKEFISIIAILHDIGAVEAQKKYGSIDGVYQEKEGPEVAKEILKKVGYNKNIDRICFIIGNHRTSSKIDGLDFQIQWEADLLENLTVMDKEKEQEKMKTGLEKTRTGFWGNILNTLTGSVIDDDMYDDLEEQLILADVGGEVAVRLVDKLRDRVHEKGLKTGEEAADALRDIIAEEMTPDAEMDLSGKPAVILVIGVNGVGKTTSIAKLADHYTREGKKVMLAAGDTFRAAASEQLEIWADRAGVPIVSAGEGADPAAVIFDTVKSATARGYDMVIADTAGRLHNKANLMAELSKISRSVKKASPEASLETLLVLDAITGQNAISQAKEFCKAADATGIILTKLDGTAKGGCVVAVKQRLGLPVRFIGVGEGIDDLLPFTPEGFVEELLPRQWKH